MYIRFWAYYTLLLGLLVGQRVPFNDSYHFGMYLAATWHFYEVTTITMTTHVIIISIEWKVERFIAETKKHRILDNVIG